MTNKDDLHLLPMPRSLKFQEGDYSFPDQALIVIDSPDPTALYFSARSLQNWISDELHMEWEIVAGKAAPREQMGIILSVVDGSTQHPQGYTLNITKTQIFGVASEPQGIFYAVQTIKQLIRLKGAILPGLRITDWPDFPNRGVMLDISRDKVPTMDTLYELADMLASWKVNQLQLYIEHTFAYKNHPVVWEGASPITGEDILALDAYCRDRFIELVPNQNTFGHMRRWLIHDQYRHLAECPDGYDSEWGHYDEPFTLNPGDPASFELIRDMFDELLPHFSSQQVNVCCDETVELGQGHSKEIVNEIGVGRVYLEFLMKIYREVKARGLTMQFWGDILMHHPELVPELPRDVIVLEWGYEADHPFEEHGTIFARSGIPFYVCPGTGSWLSIGGRTQNARANLLSAAENGLKHGAIGYLNTDWGDRGHWQPLPVSYPGLAYGAGLSWEIEANRELELPALLDLFVFQDDAGLTGRTLIDFGRVHELVNLSFHNITILFHILQTSPEEIAEFGGNLTVLADELKQASQRIDDIAANLDGLKIQASKADLLKSELSWIAGMLKHACWRGIWAVGKVAGEEDQALKQHLLEESDLLLKDFSKIWHSRNRPGGFKDSLARLEEMRMAYQ